MGGVRVPVGDSVRVGQRGWFQPVVVTTCVRQVPAQTPAAIPLAGQGEKRSLPGPAPVVLVGHRRDFELRL